MRDIIVIGSPVGGAGLLAQLVGDFPPDLDASVFVVLHSTPATPILLADVLNAPGRMRAAEALDQEPVVRRRIYVAPSGRHLLLREGKVRLSENGTATQYRPSIDRLFSSAAEAYRARVIGVLLVHAREDGLAGLRAIRLAGGRTLTHRNELMREEPRAGDTREPLCDEHLELERIAGRVFAFLNEAAESEKG